MLATSLQNNTTTHTVSSDSSAMEQVRGGGSSSGNDESVVIMRASLFDSLPEDCMSMVIARTSPRDACVVASVSKRLNIAAQSDLVWEKFLPPEYASLVPRPLVNYSSKKEVYLSLADDSILIDDGKKSFWLEKSSGKKCYMLSAMDLTIIFRDFYSNVAWLSVPESKFEKVALLHNWYEIRGKIRCGMLSKETDYSVYAVFKRSRDGFDPPPVEARVGFVGKEATTKTLVFFEPLPADSPSAYRMRESGKNFEELGKFYINNGGCEDAGSDEIGIIIMEMEHRHWKSEFITELQGLEISPERKKKLK